MNTKDTSWGGVAEWYDELVEGSPDSFQAKVILPNLLRIVDPKPGMTVVDVACGQGYFSRAFAEKGADVVGTDISKELIEAAKKHPVVGEIAFDVAASDKLEFISYDVADVVTIILALQNIEKLSETIVEAARILKTDGRLVFVLNHPSFRIPKRSSWEWEKKAAGEVQYRRLDAYMSDIGSEIDMTPGEKDMQKKKITLSFHRPLQTYFKALSKSGFAVTRLEEWISHRTSKPGPRSSEEDRMRKEIPMFVCIEARKG